MKNVLDADRTNLAKSGIKEELLVEGHERRGDHYGPELGEVDAAHAEGVV